MKDSFGGNLAPRMGVRMADMRGLHAGELDLVGAYAVDSVITGDCSVPRPVKRGGVLPAVYAQYHGMGQTRIGLRPVGIGGVFGVVLESHAQLIAS